MSTESTSFRVHSTASDNDNTSIAVAAALAIFGQTISLHWIAWFCKQAYKWLSLCVFLAYIALKVEELVRGDRTYVNDGWLIHLAGLTDGAIDVVCWLICFSFPERFNPMVYHLDRTSFGVIQCLAWASLAFWSGLVPYNIFLVFTTSEIQWYPWFMSFLIAFALGHWISFAMFLTLMCEELRTHLRNLLKKTADTEAGSFQGFQCFSNAAADASKACEPLLSIACIMFSAKWFIYLRVYVLTPDVEPDQEYWALFEVAINAIMSVYTFGSMTLLNYDVDNAASAILQTLSTDRFDSEKVGVMNAFCSVTPYFKLMRFFAFSPFKLAATAASPIVCRIVLQWALKPS